MPIRIPEISTPAPRSMLLVAAGLAIAIFFLDTFSPLDIAIAVLYVVVVLIAGSVLQSRGEVLAVSAFCLALTVSAYVVQHGVTTIDNAFLRCLVSVAAICITTVLALRTQSAAMGL